MMFALAANAILPSRVNFLSSGLATRVAGELLDGPNSHLVLVDLEGFQESMPLLVERVSTIFKVAGAAKVVTLDRTAEYKQVWDGWLQVRGSLNEHAARIIDFYVNPMHLGKALREARGLCKEYGLEPEMVAYGLAGNVQLILGESADQDLVALEGAIQNLALGLGGSISGCKGYRLRCQAYHQLEMYHEIISLQKEIRKQFDPKGILGPHTGFFA